MPAGRSTGKLSHDRRPIRYDHIHVFDLLTPSDGPPSGQHFMSIVSGTVAFAAIVSPCVFPASKQPFYAVFLEPHRWLFAIRPPRLYDCRRRLIPAQPIAPGSTVKLSLDDDEWLLAVQIIELVDDCPFAAVG
jgi:hypothetical protein